jgi:hypothetical protein
MGGANSATSFDPAAIRKPDVHQYDLRLQSRCIRDGSGHGAGLADDLESSSFGEQRPQTYAKDFVIVHQQKPDRFGLRSQRHSAS